MKTKEMCFIAWTVLLLYNLPYATCATARIPLPWTIQTSPSVRESESPLVKETFWYAIVIDAGSGGSRAYAYKFSDQNEPNSLPGLMRLIDEYSCKVNQSLSGFINDPAKGVNSIDTLLKDLKKNLAQLIPEDKWATTPLHLRATAGLRSLPKIKVDRLLNEIRKSNAIRNCGFLLDDGSIELLSATHEAYHSWFSVNYLLGFFVINGVTIAVLELGGVSTQIAFIKIEHMPNASDLEKVTADSYPMGLQAVRYAVYTYRSAIFSNKLETVCMHPNYKLIPFEYGGKNYRVSGAKFANFTQCEMLVSKIIMELIHSKEHISTSFFSHKIFNPVRSVYEKIKRLVSPKPEEIMINHDYSHIQKFVGISFFCFRAETAAKKIAATGTRNSDVFTVNDYFVAADIVCKDGSEERQFLCLDLIYIGVLLRDVYKMKPETIIDPRKKVNGHEITWATSYAHHLVYNTRQT